MLKIHNKCGMLAIIFSLTCACQGSSPTTVSTPTERVIDPIMQTPIQTATSTATPIPTNTPTETPLPTATETPTLTPNPSPTPLPWSNVKIGSENAKQIEELAQYGLGRIRSLTHMNVTGTFVLRSPLGLFIYEAESNEPLALIEETGNVIFSPTGELLLTNQPGSGDINIWDLATGSLVATLEHGSEESSVSEEGFEEELFLSAPGVKAMAFSPTAGVLAVGYGENEILIWSTETWEAIMSLTSNVFPAVNKLVFSPDERFLATTGQALGIWSLEDGTLLGRMPNAGDMSNKPYSPNGELFLTLPEGAIQIWSFPDLRLLHTYAVSDYSRDVVFSKDSEHFIIKGSVVRRVEDGSRLRVDKEEEFLNEEYAALQDAPTAIKEEADDEVLSNYISNGHYPGFSGLALESSSIIKSWGVDGEQFFWMDLPITDIQRYDLNERLMNDVEFSSGFGEFAFCGLEALSRLPLSSMEARELPGCGQSGRLLYLQDGRNMARASKILIDIIDLESGEVTNNLRGHRSNVTALAESSDGSLIASGSEVDRGGAEVYIWNTDPYSIWQRWTISSQSGGYRPISILQFSPDDSYLLVGGADSFMKLYRVSDGWQLHNLELATNATSARFSPDGDLAAIGDGRGNMSLWSIPDGEELITVQAHAGAVTGLAFTPDGANIVSASGDGTVKIWGVE